MLPSSGPSPSAEPKRSSLLAPLSRSSYPGGAESSDDTRTGHQRPPLRARHRRWATAAAGGGPRDRLLRRPIRHPRLGPGVLARSAIRHAPARPTTRPSRSPRSLASAVRVPGRSSTWFEVERCTKYPAGDLVRSKLPAPSAGFSPVSPQPPHSIPDRTRRNPDSPAGTVAALAPMVNPENRHSPRLAFREREQLGRRDAHGTPACRDEAVPHLVRRAVGHLRHPVDRAH